MDQNRDSQVELYEAYTIEEVIERREMLSSSSGSYSRSYYPSSSSGSNY
jgi:hypothetical protein